MDEETNQAIRANASAGQLAGATTAVMPSYLEQLANELSHYRELINILNEKLEVVSERAPSEPSDGLAKEPRVHISTMVQIIRRNNRDLNKLISEIAL